MTTPPDLLAGSATGSIYDLGYRRYDGPRLGRRHAVWALVVHGLKAAFGLGRSGRAKFVPLALLGLIALPAVVSVAFTVLAGDAAARYNPITLAGYLDYASTLLVFFVAAQAPELLVGDQRNQVLTLYFSRALERTDYIIAKFLALFAAVVFVLAVPQLVLVLGTLFSTPSLTDGLGRVGPDILPALARTLVVAALFAALGLAASAFTNRRAFAAATVITVFLVVSNVVGAVVDRVGLEGPLILVALADPFALIGGTSAFFFGVESSSLTVLRSGLPTWLFTMGAVAATFAALGVLQARYRRIAA